MKNLLPILGLLAAFLAAVIFIGYAFKQTTGPTNKFLFGGDQTKTGFNDLIGTPTETSTPTPTP